MIYADLRPAHGAHSLDQVKQQQSGQVACSCLEVSVHDANHLENKFERALSIHSVNEDKNEFVEHQDIYEILFPVTLWRSSCDLGMRRVKRQLSLCTVC